MLTFKTQFPIANTKSVEDLLECIRIWITGSPHSKMKNMLGTSKLVDGASHVAVDESLSCSSYKDNEQEIAGVRYEKKEDGEVRWITDVVGCKKYAANSFVVSVQLDVDSELPVERLDQGKRPYILKSIMQHLGGGQDGALTVSDSPIKLEEKDVSLAANLVCGNAGLAMPIAYVSADNQNRPFIDIDQTAKWLSGMAHVVVEPSRAFSFSLMREVYSENAYGGAVCIYWPDGIGKWLFLPGGKYSDSKEMQIAISRKVRSSLLSQRTRKECTWSYLQELLARKRLQELIDSGSKNIDEYIRHFDVEISSKDEEIRRLEAELSRARYARQFSNDSSDRKENDITLHSTENDFYQAERLDIIIDVLETAANNSEQNSRRKDVLSDIASRHRNSGERDRILDQLKNVLRQYTAMTPAVRASLEALGFEISDDGKHYKLIYRKDTRYPFILAKSGSDWRGGMNAFSDLKRRLF